MRSASNTRRPLWFVPVIGLLLAGLETAGVLVAADAVLCRGFAELPDLAGLREHVGRANDLELGTGFDPGRTVHETPRVFCALT